MHHEMTEQHRATPQASRGEVKRGRPVWSKKNSKALVKLLLIEPLEVQLSKVNLKIELEEEADLNEGVFSVWGDSNTTGSYTAIFLFHKSYTATQVVLRKQGAPWQCRYKSCSQTQVKQTLNEAAARFKVTERRRSLGSSSEGKFTLNKSYCSCSITLQA